MAKDILNQTHNILLLEDDEILADVCVEMLEILGYTAKTFSSGEDCINLYKKNSTINLAMIDISLSGKLDGNKTYETLKRINSNLKCILTTGDTYNIKEEYKSDNAVLILSKPYTINKLEKALQYFRTIQPDLKNNYDISSQSLHS